MLGGVASSVQVHEIHIPHLMEGVQFEISLARCPEETSFSCIGMNNNFAKGRHTS
jgi:hypothetical protein